jgi:hypothetical protein
MGLIPLGILSSAGGGFGTYELIESQILGSNSGSITFSSLDTYASVYKHLQIRMVTKLSQSSTATDQLMRFNGVTSTSYSGHRLLGNGSSVSSDSRASSSSAFIGFVDGDQFTAAVIDVLDVYATKNKTVRCLLGAHGFAKEIMLTSGLFNSTAAITSITLFPVVYNYLAGSRFSLYGIR